MPIDTKYLSLGSFAAFMLACSGSPEPEAAPVEGDSSFALDSADAAGVDEDAAAVSSGGSTTDVDKRRGPGHPTRHRHRSRRPHHPVGGGGYPPSPPEPPPQGCIAVALAPDGVCSETPDGPCKLEDPDCFAGKSCEVAGQTFADGVGVPSGDSCNSCGCNDGSVFCTEVFCEPVFCALFVEQPNGVCSRFPLDPCISQDPDCLESIDPAAPAEPAAP